MILKCINVVILAVYLSACSSSSGSNSDGTSVALFAAPSPSVSANLPAGSKTFTTAENHMVVLTRAYLVLASTTIETECGATFSAGLDSVLEGLLNTVIPVANAHTTTTPTSTGVPFVINLLSVDGGLVDIGSVSPPPADYCGVNVDLLAADADTLNLPADVDMVGKTIFIEGSYTLAVSSGGATGNINLSTGSTLINRELLLSSLLTISSSNLNGTINLGINYDTWFDGVDLQLMEAETSVLDTHTSQVLQNITSSIHQI